MCCECIFNTVVRCASNFMPLCQYVNLLRKFNVKRDLRFCTLCNNKEVGTEVHVTMHCENGNIIKCREGFFQLIFASSAQLQIRDTEQLFRYLSAYVKTKITYYFAIFVDKIH